MVLTDDGVRKPLKAGEAQLNEGAQKIAAEGRQLISELRAVEHIGKKKTAELLVGHLERMEGILRNPVDERGDRISPAPNRIQEDFEDALTLARVEANNLGRVLYANQERIRNARNLLKSLLQEDTLIGKEIASLENKGSALSHMFGRVIGGLDIRKIINREKKLASFAAAALQNAGNILERIEKDEASELILFSGSMQLRQNSIYVGVRVVRQRVQEGSFLYLGQRSTNMEEVIQRKLAFYRAAYDELSGMLDRARMIRLLHHDLEDKSRLMERIVAELESAFAGIADVSRQAS